MGTVEDADPYYMNDNISKLLHISKSCNKKEDDMMKAIVYTTNTGSSKAYADMLGAKTALPVYAWDDAVSALSDGTEIFYIGWLMAGTVMNLAKAQKKFNVRAVCAVGMTSSHEMEASVRTRNKLSSETPLFLLQGAYDKRNLHGMYRFAMKIVGAALEKKISAIPDRNEEEELILKMLRNGGSGVKEEKLDGVLAWYEKLSDGENET